MHCNAQASNLLLYRRENGDDRRQRLLVLGHHSPDVFDVLPSVVLLPGVRLDVLETDVEELQRALDGVDLRQREQLDDRLAWDRRREGAPGAGLPRGGHRTERHAALGVLVLRRLAGVRPVGRRGC